ncbi:hypothetical protein RIF29_11235 [Crotalaria pallida]|uniref:Cystatin domain-containing protein n=1 Tax=Crotalaria pallida TaxID=3830 RepID=A0AAN9ILY0_CROPI
MAVMKVRCLLLLVFVTIVVVSTSTSTSSEAVRGRGGVWIPIKNVNERNVVEVAKFAVAEYDSATDATLRLRRVIKGEKQVVAGTTYRLVLAASDNNNYEAVVLEKPWLRYRSLDSFRPLDRA